MTRYGCAHSVFITFYHEEVVSAFKHNPYRVIDSSTDIDNNYIVIIVGSMNGLIFEWDVTKNASNKKKHGVCFGEAKSAFSDPYARLIADPDHSSHEERFILLGTSIHSHLLVVCHCLRTSTSTEDTIRIISARKANKQERNFYEELRHA